MNTAPIGLDADVGWLRHFVRESQAALCRRIAPRIPADVRGLIDADDVLQEAYLDLFRHVSLPSASTNAVALRRWLGRIALHRLTDAVRIQRAAKRGGDRSDVVAARQQDGSVREVENAQHVDAAVLPEVDMHEEVDRALSTLPPTQRTALRLVYLEGRSLRDAAGIMGRSPASVRSMCYKARRSLRLSLPAELVGRL